MKIKCDFCGAMVDETEKSCPNCGAPLSGVNRTAPGQPKTIEELKQWYVDHNLPPEDVTRFFIGKNYKEPKAFGIYKDDAGDYVVYKNKADGSRAVRYRGSDEEYAVNELYLRLKEEILNQKERNVERRAGNVKSGSSSADIGKGFGKGIMKTLVIMMATYIGLGLFAMGLAYVFSIISPSDKIDPKPSEGYYSYEGNDYYKQGNDWYYYDASGNDWGHTVEEKIPEAVAGDIDGQYRTEDHEGMAFEDSFWYHEPTEETDNSNSYDRDDDDDRNYRNDSWDSNSNWDSNDSWDSNDTDWDSDW